MALATDVECNPVRGVNDESRTLFGSILSAAAILAAAYNSKKAIELAIQEWELATRYWRLAKNWMDYYSNVYAPVEDQEVAEAIALQPEKPYYDTMRGRARVGAYIATKSLFAAKKQCLPKYLTGKKGTEAMKLFSMQANAVAAADGMGYRHERAYIEARDDVRFEKQLNVAKRGRNMVAGNISFAKTAAGIYGSLYDQTWSNLQNSGLYLGYENYRQVTAYPQTLMSSGQPESTLDIANSAIQHIPQDNNLALANMAAASIPRGA